MTLRIHPGLTLVGLLALCGLAESLRSFAADLPFVVRAVCAALIFACAVALLFWAIATFLRAHTSPEPNREPSAIVTTGPFRYSRNPMYIANILLILGFAFLTGSAWFVVAALVQFALLNFRVIPTEEARLQRAFPDAAAEWFAKTRRWM